MAQLKNLTVLGPSNFIGNIYTYGNDKSIKIGNASYSAGLHMSSDGVNRGLYDWTLNKWMIYAGTDSIQMNGNATTATTWQNARNFYVADNTATNTGPATSVNGSGNVTLKLPATIKAALTGNVTGNVSGSSGSCTGNAATATSAGKLTSNIAFTPAETALTPANVKSLIGDNSQIRKGTWSYAGNGHIATGSTATSQCPFGVIDLAGTTVIQSTTGTEYTQVYITPPTASATGAIKGEMLYYIDQGSSYTPTWYRVLTNANYNNYAPSKTGTGASGTWGISITGNATSASRALKIETYKDSTKAATYGNQWQVCAYWETNNGPIRLASDQNESSYNVIVDLADSATKATQDGSGNTITSYYCTLGTTQTLSGAKTFTQPIGITTAAKVQYNSTDECLEFIFS